MEFLITILHVLVCLALVGIVLLQPGKGGSVGSAFGGGSSDSLFGGRGATPFLAKLTSGAALVFMLTSLTLAWFSSKTDSVITPDIVKQAPANNNETTGTTTQTSK